MQVLPQSDVVRICLKLYEATFMTEFGFSSFSVCKTVHKCFR
jgi:hypothetical protein